MRLTKIAAGAAALALSAGLLAGCGDKDDKKDDTTGSSSSTSTGGDAATGGELTKDNFVTEISHAMTKAGSAHVKMTMSGAASMDAEGDQITGEKPEDSSVALTMNVSGMSMEVRMVDNFIYLNLGQVTNDKFAALDLSDTSNPAVKQFGSLAEQGDLAKQIEVFDDAITKFEKTDKVEKIDGVDAQGYDLTADGKKIAAASGAEGAAGIPGSFVYTFYIGPDNLVRRIAIDVSGQKIQMDYTDWGKPVTIEKPKASEITDVDLASMLGG